MANQRRSSRQFGGTPTRRRTSWAAGPGGTGVTSISATSSGIVGSSLAPAETGLTVARIRGLLKLDLISFTSPGDGFQGAFGIGIATTAAVAAGVGSIPTPLTEQGSENWLYWTPISIHGGQETTASVPPQEVIVDSKAMRKFPGEMSLYAIQEVVEVGTGVVSLFFDCRVLFFLA